MFAPADQVMRRIHVDEQEVPRKDRKYGRYQTGSIWSPRRPTVTYIGSIPVGLVLTEMTERVTMRYLDGSYVREDSKLVRSARPWQLTHSWTSSRYLAGPGTSSARRPMRRSAFSASSIPRATGPSCRHPKTLPLCARIRRSPRFSTTS